MAGNKQIKRRLKSSTDIRRFLAETINRVNQEELDSGVAGKLGYLCQILAKVIEGSDFEMRIEALEKQLEQEKVKRDYTGNQL